MTFNKDHMRSAVDDTVKRFAQSQVNRIERIVRDDRFDIVDHAKAQALLDLWGEKAGVPQETHTRSIRAV